MNIRYSGYRENYGTFDVLIPVDETRQDYEIHMKNGQTGRQITPFQKATYDWNHDGEIYTLFGAWFDWNGSRDFITPVDMVSMVIDGDARIPGIEIPLASLDSQIQQANKQKGSSPNRQDPPEHTR